jgi:hypothetical protein
MTMHKTLVFVFEVLIIKQKLLHLVLILSLLFWAEQMQFIDFGE